MLLKFWSDSPIADYLSSSTGFINFAFWMGAGLLIATSLTLIHIVFIRITVLYSFRQRHKLANAWNPIVNAFRRNEDVKVPRLAKRHQAYFLELWIELRQLSNQSFAEVLDRLALRLGLDKCIDRILQQTVGFKFFPGKDWLRVQAITVARWLPTERTVNYLTTIAESDNQLLAVESCATLLELEAENSAQSVIKLLFRFPESAPYITAKLGQAGGGSIVTFLEPFLNLLPAYTLMNFISLIEQSDDKTLLPVLKRRLSQAVDAEELSALLRAMGKLGGENERSIVIPYLHHSVTHVRIQAAHALGRIGIPEDAELLLPLLSDENWWLRYRTAQAYINLTKIDREEYDLLMESVMDAYARDIIKHVRAENEWFLT